MNNDNTMKDQTQHKASPFSKLYAKSDDKTKPVYKLSQQGSIIVRLYETVLNILVSIFIFSARMSPQKYYDVTQDDHQLRQFHFDFTKRQSMEYEA